MAGGTCMLNSIQNAFQWWRRSCTPAQAGASATPARGASLISAPPLCTIRLHDNVAAKHRTLPMLHDDHQHTSRLRAWRMHVLRSSSLLAGMTSNHAANDGGSIGQHTAGPFDSMWQSSDVAATCTSRRAGVQWYRGDITGLPQSTQCLFGSVSGSFVYISI